MTKFICALGIFVTAIRGLVYIDRYTTKSSAYGNITISFRHDLQGNSITNVTLNNFFTVEKALLYINIKAAEDQNDRDYKITLVKTVADAEKTFKSMQSNLFLRGFTENMIKFIDFDLKFPLPPVRNFFN